MNQKEVVASERVSGCFAADDSLSADRRKQGMDIPPSQKIMVIHFTPRSGSTWLSSLLEGTGHLGTGLELFNPNFMPESAKFYGARTLTEYMDLSRRFSARGGVLSFEITSHQLRAVFKNSADFFNSYPGAVSYWLIREDIVAQAVSLAKMVRTQIGHAPQSSISDREKADASFSYDNDEIKRWLQHILVAEQNSENFFVEYGINPLRFSYEQMMQVGTNRLLQKFMKSIGQSSVALDADVKTSYQKIGTIKNDEFALRFRAENEAYLDEVAVKRATWLSKLRSGFLVDDLA